MNDLQMMEQERSVLRWGGLAGIVGGILLVAVFVIVGVFVGPAPSEAEGLVMRFPDVRAAHIVEEALYLGVLALWAVHFLALYRALRGSSLAPALFGSVLGIMGLVVLAAAALPQVVRTPISDLYHAPGATPEDQATLVLLWQATQGMLDALLVTGLLLVPTGVIALGVSMLGSATFGKGVGGVSVAIGVSGLAAGIVLLIDPGSPIAAVGILSLIVFHLVLGWKVYKLSRGPVNSLGGGGKDGHAQDNAGSRVKELRRESVSCRDYGFPLERDLQDRRCGRPDQRTARPAGHLHRDIAARRRGGARRQIHPRLVRPARRTPGDGVERPRRPKALPTG